MIQDLINKVLEQVNSNQFLSGGLVLGAITSVFYSLRAIPTQIWSRVRRKLVFEVTIEQQDELYGYLQLLLNTKYSKELRAVKASFWRVTKTDDDEGLIDRSQYNDKKQFREQNKVVFNHYGDSFIVFYRNRFIRIASNKEKFENASNITTMFFEKYMLSRFLCKNAIYNFLQEAATFAIEHEKQRERPNIKFNTYDGFTTDRTAMLRDIETVFINQDKKQVLLSDLKDFTSNQAFYSDRNIPYRRGYLLYGPPGTGKSSLVSAIANMLKRDLYIMNLKSTTSDDQFVRVINSVKSGSILIFEDIDGYFDGRKDKTKVSFSTFLNELSGVRSKNDIILFVTTNHKTKLDSALLRPGRLDMHFEIDYPTSKEISAYLSWFYSRPIEIGTDNQFSMADIENICCQNKFCFPAALVQIQSKK